MKSMLSISAALMLTASLVAAPHAGGHGGNHKTTASQMGHYHGMHPHHGQAGSRHHVGHVHHGHQYRHHCFNANWHDWTRRCWCPRYGFYIYWCPAQSCWYRYVGSDQTYVPCDNMTSEFIDGNNVMIDEAN